jgi:hypothetical protein
MLAEHLSESPYQFNRDRGPYENSSLLTPNIGNTVIVT